VAGDGGQVKTQHWLRGTTKDCYKLTVLGKHCVVVSAGCTLVNCLLLIVGTEGVLPWPYSVFGIAIREAVANTLAL
jgi:hypothetical protein